MSDCRTEDVQLGCFTPTTGEPVTVKYITVFDESGINIAEYYADAAGVTIDPATYLGGGVATLGECEVNTLDICVIDPDAENGITGKRWDSEGNAAPWATTGEIFPKWNEHINGDPDEVITVTNNWALADLDFPVTGALDATDRDISSQEFYFATIYAHQDMWLSDTNGNTGEYISIFKEDCNKDMVQVVKDHYSNRAAVGAGPFLKVCKGFHTLAIQIVDYSAYGGFFLRYSVDEGETSLLFPMSQTWPTKPQLISKCVKKDPESGELSNLDGSPITETVVDCNPVCYPMSRPVLPDTEVIIDEGCDDIDGDPANYVPITREVVYIDGVRQSGVFYTEFGADTQAEYPNQNPNFVNCLTGEPIEEPVVVACEDSVYVGLLNKLVGDLTPATTIDWWAPLQGTFPLGNNAAPHDNVSNIFSVVDNRLVHINGDPDASFIALTFSTGGTSSAAFVAGVGAASSAETSGTDQIVARGWFVTTRAGQLTDTNANTGERGGLWLDECGESGLELLSERTINTSATERGVFSGVSIPAGIHYVEAAISDASAWGGFQLSISYDGGVTQENVIAYQSKPYYDCVPVMRCLDSGLLYDGSIAGSIVPVEVTEFDTWCDTACSKSCGGSSDESSASSSHLIEGCVDVDGSIVAGYTLVDSNGDALFAPRPVTDLGFVNCCDASNDSGGGTTEDFGSSADGVLVSDNFQDGNGNAPFNLQVRNTTGNATDWTAVVRDVPYATIPSLNAGAYTLSTTDNGDGTYTHAFTGTSQLGAFANITITGGTPVPAGTGTASGNPELYI